MAENFEQFVEEHYVSAYRFALSLCRQPADACDLTQQVFFIAQTKFHQVREASKQKSWLFTILAREFRRSRRQSAKYEHHPLELVEADLPLITVDHATQIDARGLLAPLLALDEHFRVPLSLFYFEQLSYKEIAQVMQAPIGTVMSRLARGKELLRQSLEKNRRTQDRAGQISSNPSGPSVGGTANEDHG